MLSNDGCDIVIDDDEGEKAESYIPYDDGIIPLE